jgi:hypothetical protein
MRQPAGKGRRKIDYPDETNGTRWAAEARKRASQLSAEQEAEYFRKGMGKIYGGQAKEATGAYSMLVTSDKHLLDIEENALLLAFNEADLFAVHPVSPKGLLRALR